MSSRRALLESLLLSRLPSAFQEVEYIESSGTQYIDTSWIPNNNTKAILRVENTQTSNQVFFGGDTLNYNGSYFCNINETDNLMRVVYGSGSSTRDILAVSYEQGIKTFEISNSFLKINNNIGENNAIINIA